MGSLKESVDHLVIKHYYFEKLTKLGYKCTFEKTLRNPNNKDDKIRVDLYAENNEEIVIVEVIHSSWSGKNPRKYIPNNKRNKKFRFIKQGTVTGRGLSRPPKKSKKDRGFKITLPPEIVQKVETSKEKFGIENTKEVIYLIMEFGLNIIEETGIGGLFAFEDEFFDLVRTQKERNNIAKNMNLIYPELILSLNECQEIAEANVKLLLLKEIYEEVHDLYLELIENMDFPCGKLIIYLYLVLGISPFEVVDLKLENVDFEDNLITTNVLEFKYYFSEEIKVTLNNFISKYRDKANLEHNYLVWDHKTKDKLLSSIFEKWCIYCGFCYGDLLRLRKVLVMLTEKLEHQENMAKDFFKVIFGKENKRLISDENLNRIVEKLLMKKRNGTSLDSNLS